jgi:hypothetical protein
MTPLIVSDILDSAREIYLNDSAARTYTNEKLLPYLKSASGFLETELEENGVPCKNEISTPYLVPVGNTELTTLPTDFVWPVRLSERLYSTTDQFTPMIMRAWEPQTKITERLQFWTYRKDRIFFIGASTDREVILYYQAAFNPINVVNDQVYARAEQYLIAKTSALALLFGAQSEKLASIADQAAEKNIAQVINISIKKQQGTTYRRKPYSPYK